MLLRVFSKLSKLLSFFFLSSCLMLLELIKLIIISLLFNLFDYSFFSKSMLKLLSSLFFVIHSFWLFHIATRSYQNYYHLFYYLLFSIIFLFQKINTEIVIISFFCYPLFLIFSCQNHKGVLKFFFTVEVPAQLAC